MLIVLVMVTCQRPGLTLRSSRVAAMRTVAAKRTAASKIILRICSSSGFFGHSFLVACGERLQEPAKWFEHVIISRRGNSVRLETGSISILIHPAEERRKHR